MARPHDVGIHHLPGEPPITSPETRFRVLHNGLPFAGQVAGNLALLVTQEELGDIVLLNIRAAQGLAKGKALDIVRLLPVDGYDARVNGTSSYDDMLGAHVYVITAGIACKPDVSREGLLDTNIKIITNVATHLTRACPQAFCIVVSNPLDAMVCAFKNPLVSYESGLAHDG